MQCMLNAQKRDCIFLREAISNSCGGRFYCIDDIQTKGESLEDVPDLL